MQKQIERDKEEESTYIFILVYPNLGLRPILNLQDEISINTTNSQLDQQPLNFTTLLVPHWASNLTFARPNALMDFIFTIYYWVLQKMGL